MKFALICSARSGSTAISNLLRDIGVYLIYEPFRPSKTTYYNALSALLANDRADGVKHIYNHLSVDLNCSFVKVMHSSGVKLVYLRRRNKFLAAVSHELCVRTGVWEYDTKDPLAVQDHSARFWGQVDKFTIGDTIADMEIMEKQLDAQGLPAEYFDYEDLFGVPLDFAMDGVLRLLEYTGIEAPDYLENMVKEHMAPDRKQHTPDFLHKITNWTELKEEFYEWLDG